MAYCSRDGPGNHRAHIKTQACLSHRGAPVKQVVRSASQVCATKVKSQCKEPCQWKQGPQRKFCSKRRRAAAVPAPMAAAVAVVRRRRSVAKKTVGLCAGKTQPNCLAPCRWNNGPKRQFCTKGGAAALKNTAVPKKKVTFKEPVYEDLDLLQSFNISNEPENDEPENNDEPVYEDHDFDFLLSFNISNENDLNQWLSNNENADKELKQRVINSGVRYFSEL